MSEEIVRSNQEAAAIKYLNASAKLNHMKGRFHTNIRPEKNPEISFDLNALRKVFAIPIDGPEFSKYINKAIQDCNCSYNYKCDISEINSHKWNFECDIVYVVKGKVTAIIEIQGPHHYSISHPMHRGKYVNFTKTKFSDFRKEKYCKFANINFFETKLDNGTELNFNDLDKIIQQLS